VYGLQTKRRAPLTSAGAVRARQIFIIVATLLFGADLATKNWAESSLQFREPIKVIGDFLQFTYTTNKGAAFNLVSGATYILTALKLCVATFLIFYMSRVISRAWALALGLLFGGVVGNLWDRATRPPGRWAGEVVDWIQIPHWPVFNLADSSIVISALLITFLASKNIKPTADREKRA
jgi:signal peptidase II